MTAPGDSSPPIDLPDLPPAASVDEVVRCLWGARGIAARLEDTADRILTVRIAFLQSFFPSVCTTGDPGGELAGVVESGSGEPGTVLSDPRPRRDPVECSRSCGDPTFMVFASMSSSSFSLESSVWNVGSMLIVLDPRREARSPARLNCCLNCFLMAPKNDQVACIESRWMKACLISTRMSLSHFLPP